MNEKEFVFWALGFTSTLTKEERANDALAIIMSKLSEIKTTITTDGVKAADSYASIYKAYTELGRCRDNESELTDVLRDKAEKARVLQAEVLEYNKQEQVAIVSSLDYNEQLKSMELQTGMEALEATGGLYSSKDRVPILLPTNDN